MLPPKLSQHQHAELVAIRRLKAAGYAVEGWDFNTGLYVVGRIEAPITNHEKSQFWSFPTWQAAASALLG